MNAKTNRTAFLMACSATLTAPFMSDIIPKNFIFAAMAISPELRFGGVAPRHIKGAPSPDIADILSSEPPLPELTERQAKLLAFASKGLSNPEIARLLGITVIAVKKHFEVIYAKIGASNRSEAIAIALRNNLLKS